MIYDAAPYILLPFCAMNLHNTVSALTTTKSKHQPAWKTVCYVNFSWGDVSKCLLTSDKAPITDQNNDSTLVYCGK